MGYILLVYPFYNLLVFSSLSLECRISFGSFQFLFLIDGCSVGSCDFGVLVGEGIFKFLLLYHLVWLHRLGEKKNNLVPLGGGMMAEKMALPFITLNISYYSLWLSEFLLKKSADSLRGSFVLICCFSLLLIVFSLSLIVVILVTMCLDAFLLD